MKTFLRRIEILNFLKSQHQSVGTEEILQHLIDSAYLDTQESKLKSQFRLIQRDLIFLLGGEIKSINDEPDEYDNDFGLAIEKGTGKSRLWRLDPYQNLSYSFEKMPAFMALALSVTQKHLKQVLPSDTQHELKRIFLNAEEKLHKSEQKLSPLHYQRLTQAVEFFQRGQRLQAPQFDITTLDKIYRAILNGKQISISYQNKGQIKQYDLHPFGVVIMLPKLYLIAKKEGDIQKGNEAFRSFLIHKIENIELNRQANKVPDNFQLKSYIDAGNMDVFLDRHDTEHYTLQLELMIDPSSNLLSDLQESPVSADQSLTQISETSWQLSASVQRTIQLKNWLLSLGSQARVLSPKAIRQDLVAALDAMRNHYP